MGFYDLLKEERKKLVKEMNEAIEQDLKSGNSKNIRKYASDSDTYIRKNTYLLMGRTYHNDQDLRDSILNLLENLYQDNDEKIRQTVVYTLGEIGRKMDADKITGLLEKALEDGHHSVRNVVTSALKRMGEKNPKPTLEFAKRFLHHPDPKVRQEIVHGIELRGRTHPGDVLPLLAEVQNDPDKKVQKKIIHVLAQISYKKGCLEKVITALKSWENKELVEKALEEILEVHKRYEQFSAKSYKEAKEYIELQFRNM
ncbi:MAG: HEAT repeat domain-containing protein [Promethearchaeota archaeon]